MYVKFLAYHLLEIRLCRCGTPLYLKMYVLSAQGLQSDAPKQYYGGDMHRRFFLSIAVSVTMLAVALGFATAQAASPTVGQRIWCGLESGASLNFSLDAANCQPEQSDSSEPATKNYVALGDSIAAGLGLAGSTTNSCKRSTEAYSQAVATALNMKLQNFACSGATAGDLVTRQHIQGPNPPAQLKQAFRDGTPDLITVTVGANDVHWAGFTKACYAGDCATRTNTRLANGFLTALQAKLYYALYSIKVRSHGAPPQVVLTGYYQTFSDQCAAIQTEITPREISWLRAETDALNQTVRQVAAHFSFVTFAPVDFTGHDVCSMEPWLKLPGEPGSFHPNLAGQAAIAQAVLAKISQ